jgi:hypothetical protein
MMAAAAMMAAASRTLKSLVSGHLFSSAIAPHQPTLALGSYAEYFGPTLTEIAMQELTERRILVLGMTYPSYSVKYVENVCTGALLENTNEMIRIHPIPRRYMEEDKRFRSFQWIKAKIAKHPEDPRPESYRIDQDSIELGDVIDSHDTRRRHIENSPHMCRSVEELRIKNEKSHGLSLGIVKPKEITGFKLVAKTEKEKKEWKEKEYLLKQQNLFDPPPRALDFPEYNFQVSWRCDDPSCEKSHDMGLLQWGLHELYRKLRSDPDVQAKMIAKMNSELDLMKRDVYLFLGSFRGRMDNFGLMSAYCPPKQQQGRLF